MPGVIRASGCAPVVYCHAHYTSGKEAMLLFMPATALHFIGATGASAAFWQVGFHVARYLNTGATDRISQHVLAIKIITRRIVRELQHHRPHHWRTGFVGARRFPRYRYGIIRRFCSVKKRTTSPRTRRRPGPRNPVGFCFAMQAAVAGEQAECAPTAARHAPARYSRIAISWLKPKSDRPMDGPPHAGFPPSIRSWRNSRRPVHRRLCAPAPGERGRTAPPVYNADGLSARFHQFVVDIGIMVYAFFCG